MTRKFKLINDTDETLPYAHASKDGMYLPFLPEYLSILNKNKVGVLFQLEKASLYALYKNKLFFFRAILNYHTYQVYLIIKDDSGKYLFATVDNIDVAALTDIPNAVVDFYDEADWPEMPYELQGTYEPVPAPSKIVVFFKNLFGG
jgi:hypothetical protein